MHEELHDEFHSSFWSYVRTGEGEAGDDRAQTLESLAGLPPEQICEMMLPSDVAAILSVSVSADVLAIKALLSEDFDQQATAVAQRGPLLHSDNQRVVQLLEGLRVGSVASREYYRDIAACLVWGLEQPGLRVYLKAVSA